MTKTLCFAAALALSGSLAAAQTPSPAPPASAPAATAPAATPAAAPAATPAATAKPDLTGTWKLNLEKSDYDQVPPPSDETLTFARTGSTSTIATVSDNERGKEVYTLPFTTDGAETPTPSGVFADTATLRYLSTKGEWQGSSLILTQKIMYQDSPGSLRSVLTLSPDGKTLTCAMHISVDQGEFDTTSVYEKQ
ncbi:MAG TPA: hypothetical protein VGU67_13185 [Edaphobacter sp.]|nr:hypothetical protein [Edaphobacter sp.]